MSRVVIYMGDNKDSTDAYALLHAKAPSTLIQYPGDTRRREVADLLRRNDVLTKAEDIVFPQVFINDHYIGGLKEVKDLTSDGTKWLAALAAPDRRR